MLCWVLLFTDGFLCGGQLKLLAFALRGFFWLARLVSVCVFSHELTVALSNSFSKSLFFLLVCYY